MKEVILSWTGYGNFSKSDWDREDYPSFQRTVPISGDPGGVIFLFSDPKDAIVFKLRFSGELRD